ncbi:MAG TPA: hypothetical protein VFQ61_37470 [Polyangiaceae bacterium]|nr:hypothetical protein [Polyangiaceae bacterium]
MKRVPPSVVQAADPRESASGQDDALAGQRESCERLAVWPRAPDLDDADDHAGPAGGAAPDVSARVHKQFRPGSVEALAAALEQLSPELERSGEQLADALRQVARSFELLPTTCVPDDGSEASEAHHVGLAFAHYTLQRLSCQYSVARKDVLALREKVRALRDESLA